ncbi:MAG TPA: recombinase family protein [Candidatus Absconditabacterales bacterium]|nr:recombinase family protein [Candidatus Absconditabacterales bacterium]
MRLTAENAIIYCRVSSKGQLEGGGLNSQEVACRQYCERNGYSVINVFQDAFTGGDLDRPGLNKLFEFIDVTNKENPDKPVNVFVVDDISRIARDYQVHLELTKGLVKRGVKYETVNMKFEDTPAGKMIEGIMAIYSEYFRRNNQHQVINRQEARLLDGYRPRDYPLGYKTEKAPVGGKILVQDEPNASIIQEALLGYANGLLNSVKEVAHFLEKKGLDLRRYKKKRKDTTKVHTSLAQRILTNILYAGYIEYKRITRDKDGIVKKQRDVSLRKGKHEGLIDLETYQKIQEKLLGKRPYTHETKIINDEYPLRGFIICGCCELLFTSGKSRSRNGKQIPYYQFNKKCIHSGKSIQAVKLHTAMNEELQKLGIDKQFLGFMKILISQEYEQRKQDKKLSTKNIQKDIDKSQGEIDNLLNSLASSSSSIVQKKIEQKIEECELKRLKLTEQLKQIETSIEITKVLDLAFEILSNPYYIRKNGTIDQKQMLLRLLFSKKIPIDFSTGTYGTLPFSSLFLHTKDIGEHNYSHLETIGAYLNTYTIMCYEKPTLCIFPN